MIMSTEKQSRIGSSIALAAAGLFGISTALAAQDFPAPEQEEEERQPAQPEQREAAPEPEPRAEREVDEDGDSLVDVISEKEELEKFAEILEQSGYADRFAEELSAMRHSETTILAPHNDAFEDLPDEVIEKMKDPDNRLEVAEVIDHHLFPQGRTAEEMKEAPALFNYSARNVTVEEGDDAIEIRTEDAEVKVVEADLEASDGYVHVVDDFLVASIDESTFEREEMAPQMPEQQQPQQQQPQQQPQPQQPPQQQPEGGDDEEAAPW